MKLNYQLHIAETTHNVTPIIIIHGLFGSLNNLRTISTYLAHNYNIIQIDLRNHGNSPHHHTMTYVSMAQDVLQLLDYLLIKKCIIIGHSMGGKVAMTLSALDIQQRINKIIIIDIAPVKYKIPKYNNIFQAIDYINKFNIQNKSDVISIMQQNFIKKNIILFLLKSFRKGSWCFNFKSIKENYNHINSWSINNPWQGKALFIKGSLSSYIKDIYIQDIYDQFPYAYICTVPNAGHWVHYDNPQYVLNIIDKFILN